MWFSWFCLWEFVCLVVRVSGCEDDDDDEDDDAADDDDVGSSSPGACPSFS